MAFWIKNRWCHWNKDFCLISCPTVFYVIQEVRLVFFPTAILLVSLTNIIKGRIFDSIRIQKNIIGFKRPRNSRFNNSLVKFPGIFESVNPLKMEPSACNFIKKETLAQVFSCEFCEIFKNLKTRKISAALVLYGRKCIFFPFVSFSKIFFEPRKQFE